MFNLNNKHIIRKIDKKALIKQLNALQDNYINLIINIDDVSTIVLRDSKNTIITTTKN